MGFMPRIILGLALVLTSCLFIECASSWRNIRQVFPEEAPEVSVSDKATNLKVSDKEEITNNVINKTININDNVENSSLRITVDNEPKTENVTEKQNNHVNNSNKLSKENEKYEYEGGSEIDNNETTTEVPVIKNTVTYREESARSIDINKYVSPEFHNKNHVYTLPISPDTEKYTNWHNDINFSTTTGYDFDRKQKDIETEVKHKLEYIDNEFAHAEKDFHGKKDIEEKLNITEVIQKPKDNETNTELQYVKYKNLTSNYNKIKNRINKETDIETGQTINYNNSYNKSRTYDATPKDYKNKISTDDEELVDKFTHKFIAESVDAKKTHLDEDGENLKEVLNQKDLTSLTKPPSFNKTSNQDHLISNKIETDATNLESALKTKSSFSYSSTRSPQLMTIVTTTTETTTKRVREYSTANKNENQTTVSISKRGSTKYIDTINPTTTMATIRTKAPTETKSNNKQSLVKKQNHTFEEVVQENQVYPIQVPAPTTDAYSEDITTTEASTLLEYLISTTTLYTTEDKVSTTLNSETTITKLDATTTFETTTDDFKFATTTSVPTITEFETSTVEPTTTTNLVTSTEIEKTTIPVTEGTIQTTLYSDNNSTTEINVATNSQVLETELNDRFTNGRGLNFSTTDHVETGAVTTKNLLPRTTTSQKIPTTTELENLTTTEMTPTTSDYRDNIIIKHAETSTTIKQLNVTKTPNPYTNGSKKKEITNIHNTTELNIRVLAKTTDMPLIIPLNISMYDEPEVTTSGQFPEENNSGKIAAIVISSIGAVCLILLAGLLFVVKKRHKRFNYGQRCTPVSLDAYSVDNVSVYNSMRRKAAMRASKRSYGNPAFDDPTSTSNPLNFPALAKFANNTTAITSEFEEIPQVTAQTNELPEGCETKNRYANVIPLPETRVFLSPMEGHNNSDYINANYVTGPKSTKNYYIACQAPLQNTVEDFWRMVWEQQSKVILMLTHLFENGSEKCIDYLPPSEVLDCHRLFGDYQVTLKKREVKEKYVISILQLKNMVSNSWRDVTHLWYLGWPEKGVPSEANSLIAFLIEARSYVKPLPLAENGKSNGSMNAQVSNGSVTMENSPIVVHCSPGTGRTGTVIACDIAIREFELTRQVDIPKTVYRIRRDRASSVQTKEQYAFIYNVITLYATKLTGGVLDSF